MDLHEGQFGGVTLGHEPANPKPLKPGQTSQGLLFRQPKPTAEHRYAAKGYTPERQAAIAAAIPKISTSSVWSHPSGTKDVVFPTLAEAGGVMRQKAWTRRAVVDVMARSTVPLETIQQNTPEVKVGPMAGALGRMENRALRTTPLRGLMRLNPTGEEHTSRGAIEHTVIHELGHHAEFQGDTAAYLRRHRTERVIYGRNPRPSPEGYAEGYSARHWVPRRNEPAGSREYKDVYSYAEFHHNTRFQGTFEKASGKTLDEAMGRESPSLLGDQFQGSLFHGPGSVGNYVKTWEKPHQVGTIKVGA